MKAFRFLLIVIAAAAVAGACTSTDPVTPELRAPDVTPVLDSTGVTTEGGGMLGGGGRRSDAIMSGVLFPDR